MSTHKGPRKWTVEATCPHGLKVDLRFDSLGYLCEPHPNTCDEHLQAPPEPVMPPPLKMSERQIRREAKRAAKAAAKKGWRPPWLSS